jgi:hypothetical protein
MSDEFLKSFSTFRNNNSRNITFQSQTLPSNECSNGFPINKYAYYGGKGTNPWEVLYSIWNSYQNTIGAQFTLKQDENKAPTSSTNSISNPTGPSQIFIIRHGEKNSSSPDYSLNNNGIYRACQLINFVNKLAEQGNPISYIITGNPCPYYTSDSSMRPQQTISMVSFMLNIPIFIYGGDQDFPEVVAQLFSSDSTNPFNGLNVLICWEHAAIQGLCLKILNEAGLKSRLTLSATNENQDWYGDAFFKQVNACPDGNYECPELDSSSPYNLKSNTPPKYIGPNSKNYPYWNNYNFDSVYWIKSDSQNIFYDFKIFNQPCLTCYSSCQLHIGLYQPLNTVCESSYKYTDEDSCELPPSTWNRTI